MFDLHKILKFTNADIVKGGKNITKTHKSQVEQGIDADGNQFAPYTDLYAKNKASGKAAQNQKSKKINPPDLTLTGKMLKSFKFIDGRNKGGELNIDYGIENKVQALKMNRNQKGIFPSRGKTMTKRADKKRVIAKPNKVGPQTELAIVEFFANTIAKNVTKRPTKITYNI